MPKRKLSSSESEASVDSIDEQIENEIVNVSFDFASPKESDFFALKKLLSPLLPDCNGLSDIVDYIISNCF